MVIGIWKTLKVISFGDIFEVHREFHLKTQNAPCQRKKITKIPVS